MLNIPTQKSQVGNPEENVLQTQERDAPMQLDEVDQPERATSQNSGNNSEPSTSDPLPAQVDKNQQLSRSAGHSSQNPTSGTNWRKINAKVKVNRAKSRMVLDYHEVGASEFLFIFGEFLITDTTCQDDESGAEEGDGEGDGDEGKDTGGDKSSDSDEEGHSNNRKGRSKNPFESEEAFEKMMKKVLGKALFEFESRKRSRTQRGNEERAARKKKAEKERFKEDKVTRNYFCVSNNSTGFAISLKKNRPLLERSSLKSLT